MQLLLIRHALPLRSEPGEGSDPQLSEQGIEQSRRLPDALARFPVNRLVSSPQRRAIQTADPLAETLGLTVDIDPRLAEYDRDLTHYVPIEQLAKENPEEIARLRAGKLPKGVDEKAFAGRVAAAVDDLVAGTDHASTVALFSHGGVINAALQHVLGNERLISFQIDYASVTRVLFSRDNRAFVAAVNETHHVWDLLPRNAR